MEPVGYFNNLVEVRATDDYNLVSYEDEQVIHYKIDQGTEGDFWRDYCEWVDASKEGELSEPIKKLAPFVFTTYLKANSEKLGNTEAFVNATIKCVQDVIESVIVLGEQKEQLLVLILEEVGCPRNQTRLRFQFPFLNTTSEIRKLIYQRFLINVRNQRILRQINIESDQAEDVFSIYTEDVPLIGSRGPNGENPMVYSAIYHRDGDDIFEPRLEHDLMNLNQFHEDGEYIEIDPEVNPDTYLPIFLSMRFQYPPTPPKSGFNVTTEEENDIMMANNFLEMMDPNRYQIERMALNIGHSLHHIYAADNAGLNVWIENLKRAHEHKVLPYIQNNDIKSYATEHYEIFGREHFTIKTLAHYAREDDRGTYEKWHTRWVSDAIGNVVKVPETILDVKSGGFKIPHTRVGVAIYRQYWLDYLCVNAGKKEWYRYDKVRWVPDDHGTYLARELSKGFREIVMQTSLRLNKEWLEATDTKARSQLSMEIARIQKFAAALEDIPSTNLFLKAAALEFYFPELREILDTNYSVLATKNKVVEVDGVDIYIRDGNPEDYISKCLPITLGSYYNWEHKRVKRVMQWMEQLHPNFEAREYFLKYLASGLYGRNLERIFAMFLGPTGAGKSLTIQLLEHTFGSYVIKIPMAALTGKRVNSSNASPEFARIEGARFVVLDEGDEKEKLNKSIFKLLASNGDSLFARFLNQNGKDVRMNAHPIVVANDPPDFPNADGAAKDRLVNFPFEAMWTNNAPKDPEEQKKAKHYPRDLNFPDEIPNLAGAFFWILTQYWTKYKTETLVQPEIVKQYTQKYWDTHDTYLMFINERIQHFKDANGNADQTRRLSVHEIYECFVRWYTKTYGKKAEIPERTIFINRMTERWEAPLAEYWYGIDFREEIVQTKKPTTSNNPRVTQGLIRTRDTAAASG